MIIFNDKVFVHHTFNNSEYDRTSCTNTYSDGEIDKIINQLRFYKTKIMESHPDSVKNLSLFNTYKANEYRKNLLNSINL